MALSVASAPTEMLAFQAWISLGENEWVPDGSNWGEQYLSEFYQTMQSNYSDESSWFAALTAGPSEPLDHQPKLHFVRKWRNGNPPAFAGGSVHLYAASVSSRS